MGRRGRKRKEKRERKAGKGRILRLDGVLKAVFGCCLAGVDDVIRGRFENYGKLKGKLLACNSDGENIEGRLDGGAD